jgi:hypothetical protein
MSISDGRRRCAVGAIGLLLVGSSTHELDIRVADRRRHYLAAVSRERRVSSMFGASSHAATPDRVTWHQWQAAYPTDSSTGRRGGAPRRTPRRTTATTRPGCPCAAAGTGSSHRPAGWARDIPSALSSAAEGWHASAGRGPGRSPSARPRRGDGNVAGPTTRAPVPEGRLTHDAGRVDPVRAVLVVVTGVVVVAVVLVALRRAAAVRAVRAVAVGVAVARAAVAAAGDCDLTDDGFPSQLAYAADAEPAPTPSATPVPSRPNAIRRMTRVMVSLPVSGHPVCPTGSTTRWGGRSFAALRRNSTVVPPAGHTVHP